MIARRGGERNIEITEERERDRDGESDSEESIKR